MDTGNNGDYQIVYNGLRFPGVFHQIIGNLTTGRSYRFKVRAINFNGESLDSDEYIFFSCLAPTNIDLPRLVSSTEDTFTVQWS